jgi:hypothetical protein
MVIGILSAPPVNSFVGKSWARLEPSQELRNGWEYPLSSSCLIAGDAISTTTPNHASMRSAMPECFETIARSMSCD